MAKGKGEKRDASLDDDLQALAAIDPDATGARRIAALLDALATVSLRYDTRAISHAKGRDHAAFVAQVARVLHESVRDATGGQTDAMLLALRRAERFALWVAQRDGVDAENATLEANRSAAVQLCALVVSNLQHALWAGAPPIGELR